MKTYSPERKCPKCDGRATTNYATMPYSGQEVIVRKCYRCGYSWHEKTLDAHPPIHPTDTEPSATTEERADE